MKLTRLLVAIAICLPILAQTPPAAPAPPAPGQAPAGAPAGRRGGAAPARVSDWPNLARYQAANASLPPAAPGKPRIVFMGDSITENWAKNRPSFFEQNGYIGRGIGGQTTQQMVLRMHQDVVALKPAVVIIVAGTNDVAENTGPMTDEQIIDDLAAMTEIARANGIKVVIGSVPPATSFFWRRDMTPAPRIRDLNVKIKNWAKSKQLVYADFWAAMSLPDGGMKPDLANDTVHPNDAGYGVMEPLAIAAINEALKSK